VLDRFTGMQVFLKVAAAGGFSAAARGLGLSPTMVTKHVAAIEDRLGAQLFQRTTRKLTLTEAGGRYRDAAERIVAETEEAEAEAAASVSEPRGTLRVNAPLSFGFREIAPAVADFARLYPGVTVDMGLNDRVIDLIDEGWDLAIRVARLTDSTLIARKLAPIRAVICASPAYLAERGTPRTTADLAEHNCLGYTLPTAAAAERWAFGPEGSLSVAVRGTFRANNGDALRMAALEGLGIVYQPTFLVNDDIRHGRLKVLTLDHPTFDFANVYAVYAHDRHIPAKIRRFVDFLAERWAGEPPWDRRLLAKG
jgi:DNA-binding transcriptional LysR family regulator